MSQYFSILYALSDWTTIFYIIPSVLIAFWAHGVTHAFVAKKYNCFDKTKNAAFTWNPLKYIDIFGFILMCAIGYGWSKTQATDLRNLKKNRKIMVHLAGPLGNLIATIAVLLLQSVLLIVALILSIQTNAVVDAVLFFMNMIIWANIVMFVTHLLPIPGFNGYNIIKTLFFENYYHKNLATVENNGKWIFTILAIIGVFYYCAEIPVKFLYKYLTNAEEWFVDFVTGGLFTGSSWKPKE